MRPPTWLASLFLVALMLAGGVGVLVIGYADEPLIGAATPPVGIPPIEDAFVASAATTHANTIGSDPAATTIPQAILPTVLRTLEIGEGNQPVLPLLKALIDRYADGDLAGADRALAALVNTVIEGRADLTGYSQSILDEGHVRLNSGPGNLPGVTMGDRLRGAAHPLWTRATATHAKDPARAAQLARVSLALAASERFQSRYGFLRPIFELNFDEFVTVARLSAQQRRTLRALADSLLAYKNKALRLQQAENRAADKILAVPSGQPVPMAMMEEAMRDLADYKAAVAGDPDFEVDVAREACILKNLGASHKSPVLVNTATAFLSKWRQENQGRAPTLARWLIEATNEIGEIKFGPRVIDFKPGDPQYERVMGVIRRSQRNPSTPGK